MPKFTQPKDITKRLNEGYDQVQYSSWHQQLRYAFGEPYDAKGSSASDDGMPYFPDITVQNLEIGQSRRILTSQFTGLSKVMYNDSEPEYPSLNLLDGESRKQFLLARQRGDGYGNGSWSEARQNAFMEGDGLGIGFLQIGLAKGKTGQQQVTARHSPTLLTLGDRAERSPDRWRWICFVHYIPEDVAEATWGPKAVKPYLKSMFDNTQSHPMKMMRLFEYYDIGYGKGDPTRALIPDAFGNEPLEVGENPFECLPFSYYVHFFPPGMRRPVGRIILQMAIQEGLNEIEEYMRSVMLNGKGFDIADVGRYERADLNAVKDGKAPRLVRRKGGREPNEQWERVAPAELPQSTLAHLNLMERRFTEGSGTTDFDRGLQPQTTRTLGENQLVDARGQVQSAWSVRQAVAFEQRTYEKAAKIAAKFDREPVWIELFDSMVLINDPAVPESSCEHFLETPARPIISEETMTFNALKQKRRERLQELLILFPAAQSGVFSLKWWGEEVLKATGTKDIRAALGQMLQIPGGEQMLMQGAMGAQGGGFTPGAQPPTMQTPQESITG